MRIALAVVLGIAIGFGGGWIAKDATSEQARPKTVVRTHYVGPTVSGLDGRCTGSSDFSAPDFDSDC
jgi:hypothetical protein